MVVTLDLPGKIRSTSGWYSNGIPLINEFEAEISG
jgi:hypothetical protein